MTRRLMTVVGARPQFVKAAAVSRAVAAAPGLEEILVHTGQHFDAMMSDAFFAELELPAPAMNLGVAGGSHAEMTARMLEGLERAMLELAPDLVVVYGDTNSTLAAALAAAKLSIPIAHVEAGLRAFDRSMPEEVNRVVVDHLSRLLFCPTATSLANLAREGIVEGVRHVGDVMYDAVIHMRALAAARLGASPGSGLEAGGFLLATLHRASTTQDAASLRRALDYLRVESRRTGLPMLLPLHPRTRERIAAWGLPTEGLRIVDPLGPLDMQGALGACAGVYTDSGGVQKEAYFHRKPCVTLRDSTEWVETIEAGWNRLWTQAEALPRREIDDYGAGDAARRIVGEIAAFLQAPAPVQAAAA